jgi:hypothetical protein
MSQHRSGKQYVDGLCLLILGSGFLKCSPTVGSGTTNILEEALWNLTGFCWWQVTQFIQLLFHTLTESVASLHQEAAAVFLLPGSRRVPPAAGRIRNELLTSHPCFVSEIRWEIFKRDLILHSGWLIDHYAEVQLWAVSDFRQTSGLYNSTGLRLKRQVRSNKLP